MTTTVGDKRLAEAKQWLRSQVVQFYGGKQGPCKEPDCDSIYCYLAQRLDRLAHLESIPASELQDEIEDAIRYAAKLGPDAFDAVEGRGLLQKRRQIAEKVAALSPAAVVEPVA